MSSERRTAEPRRLDQVGHVPRASRRSLKYGEPRPRIDEPATLRSEVRGAREPRPFTGSAELFRRRATRADIDRGCTTTVVLPEGSTGSCTRPGVSRDPTQSSSTSSSRGHRKSDVARPRRGGGQRGRIARRGQCCATPCCRAGKQRACTHQGIPRDRAWGSSTSGTRGHRESGARAGSDAVRCPARQHRPARPNGSPPRWSPTDASSLRPRSSSCATRKVSTPGLASCTGMRVDQRPTAETPSAPTRTDRRSRQPAHG